MIFAKNISKKYTRPVLRKVTFRAEIGEIVGIAGENGSGKSTMLSILAGLLLPDEGEVHSSGSIGYVPQENALFENLSVNDNLRFWSSAYGISPDPDLIKKFENFDDGFMKKKVKHLSGGMKKRLSIALASLHEPGCLIMDEPTGALDIRFKGLLLELIKDMQSAGKTVIFTTHQPDELAWCDRIYILKDGVFTYEGPLGGIDNLEEALSLQLTKEVVE